MAGSASALDDDRLVSTSAGLPGTSALPLMVQESVASEHHQPHLGTQTGLAAPRPLQDPHQRCVTPPRPALDAGSSQQSTSMHQQQPTSFLFPSFSFVGQQYWPQSKSRKRKHTLRGLAQSQQQQRQSEQSTPEEAPNHPSAGSHRSRFDSFIRDINPDLRQLLSLPGPSATPAHLSVEVEVQADSDTETEMAPEGGLQRRDATSMAHEELLENIRRLREVTEQTANQIQRIHDSLPSSNRAGCPHQLQQRWDVRVHLELVDWATGHLEGIMETNNQPIVASRLTDASQFKVHTVFHGEIVDGVNHTLLRPTDPWWTPAQVAAQHQMDRDCLACLPPFADIEAGAIKDTSYNLSDWLIMRWKEVSFLQPASTPTLPDGRHRVALSITGGYWLALNRKTGALTGVYVDEPEKPVQKIEMEVDKSRWSAAPWTGDFGVL